MQDSFLKFLVKDRQLKRSLIILILLFFILPNLRSYSRKKEAQLRQLKEKKQLVSRIPEFEKKLSALFLNGIILTQEQPLAIINNTIVRAGDEIGKNKVVKVNTDSVILNDGSAEFELKLSKPE